MAKILVTGGAGFIGSVLVKSLVGAEHTVTTFDKRPHTSLAQRVIVGDVRDRAALIDALQGQDIVYNLAAEHADNVQPVSLYEDVNVGGARNVCDAATALGVKTIIFTSSVAVYGVGDRPLDENSPHNYFNEYGRTKSLAEDVFRAWQGENAARRLVIIRPTVVFGPGNRGNVYNLLRQLSSRFFVMVGPGTNRKSLAYVDNICGFLMHVLSLPSGQNVFNYADVPDFTMNALVALVRRRMGTGGAVRFRLPKFAGFALGYLADLLALLLRRPLPISAIRVKKFCANTQIDASKAFASGYVPAVALEEGLSRMIAAEFPR
jgi:nucleoside-diphosphate-sugar epimerase